MYTKQNVAAVLALLSPAVVLTAHAEIYMTDEQAAKAIFPADVFKKDSVTLTDDEAKKVESLSDETVRNKTLTVFKAKDSTVFIDQVLGKHEFITYAVGVTKEGKVQGVEIIEYRESFGHQIRREEWRKQFVGKDKTSPLKLDKDIKNLSGATLSSAHISGGVRRILQTYEQVKGRL
ncbi:MAG TPA: FMN-binding protein [Bdellovibrio sp.]|nr:FMN-binding protein [Bdellovibrio sp.]